MTDRREAPPRGPSSPFESSERPLCEESAPANHSRRRLLQGAGALAGAGAGSALLRTASIEASPTPQTVDGPAMRRPHSMSGLSVSAGKPDHPGLAALIWNRAAFGPRSGDLDAFTQLGADDDARLTAWVDQQLDPQSIDDSLCDGVIASWNYTTLTKSQEELWADHVRSEMARDWRVRRLPAWETEQATFLRALYSNRQLNEVLADFWHNHFNVYAWDGWIQSTMVHYDRDVIRGNMLGNFRQMLGDVARSPAMLYYLDNQSNSGGNPNENYARELFELHGMGAENYYGVRSVNDPEIVDENGERRGYIDSDVYGATTCFTGWRIDDDTGLFQFEAAAHFPYQKFVLDEYIPENLGEQDGEMVLDLIVNHPGTARYIARKLCRRLIGDFPPESIVQKAADLFYAQREAPDQLKQVVRLILLSDEFRTTWGEKIKRPFEFVCSLMRSCDTNFDPTSDHFFWTYDALGQPLFSWHPPNGYPDVRGAWTGTMAMLQRWRQVNWLMEWKIGGDGESKDVRRVNFDGIMPTDVLTPSAIIDFWSNRLLGYRLPDEERDPIVEFMAYGRGVDTDLPQEQLDERLRYAVALIFMSPSFQWR